MRGLFTLSLLGAAAAATHAHAQAHEPQHKIPRGAQLVKSPEVEAALQLAQANEPSTILEQIRLNEIPAPPFNEDERGNALRLLFLELGLQDVRRDDEGNIIGVRPGTVGEGAPNVVVSAHLDTVFPEGTDVTVRQEGRMYYGRGISDDARGLASMLSVIRALDEAGVETRGTLTFVGTVGEEGLGDLRGVKHLFNVELKDEVDYFISIDGAQIDQVITGGTGSYRYRVTATGTGGHSYVDFGIGNPVHMIGRAISKIADFQVPEQPKTTFCVGRIGGGTSINSIAFESWMEVDMRSEELAPLDVLDAQFNAAMEAAFVEEDNRWNGLGELGIDVEQVGLRPPGQTPLNSLIVQVANSSLEALGFNIVTSTSSTDSNVPMALGIPAITIGGGGTGRLFHSLDEEWDSTDSHYGPQLAILIATTLADTV